MVIWITGLSGAGKTTLARALWSILKPSIRELVILDGDAIRNACGDDLGFTEPERVAQIKRLQRLARLLSEQGMVVIVAAVYAHRDLMAWNRMHLGSYFEVYLRTSMEGLRLRDPKGIYAGSSTGRIPNVVGVDIPWHTPKTPDLVIDMDHPEGPETLARRIIAAIPGLAHDNEAADCGVRTDCD
jgi:adenylylsulfate kinase-like enzyme